MIDGVRVIVGVVAVLLVAALAVAGVTAWRVEALPEVGEPLATTVTVSDAIRYCQERHHLTEAGCSEVPAARALWTASAVSASQNRYVASGGIIVLALVGAAIAVALLGARR